MGAYFDTGIIVKWYVLEVNSHEALELRSRFEPPLDLTPLHRVEITNALQLKAFRGEMTPEKAAEARAGFESDVREGLWRAFSGSLEAIYRTAESLSLLETAAIGTRTLDILHIAAALELHCEHFISGDSRQTALAKAVGLDGLTI